MSLPSYLANIKSSGIYRFVWDKSEIAGVDAEVLRLVVGYSEVGPFNTPVYVRSEAEFKKIFGGISKKLEKRGVFFHRIAIQCLASGPIIALNLKKFENEEVTAAGFNVEGGIITEKIPVEDIFNTTRFWNLDPDKLQKKVADGKYISISSTGSKESSCTVIMRGYTPKGYDLTLKAWYSSMGLEMPEYMEGKESMLLSDFFAEVYVFRGKFTPSLVTSESLAPYFKIEGDKIKLNEDMTNAFGQKVDTLQMLSQNEASNFLNVYRGILLPEFKTSQGTYISLDILFNSDNDIHNLMMDFNTEYLEGGNLDKLDTTGWLNSGSNVFSIEPLEVNVVDVNFDGTEWKYDENQSCFDADIYKYNEYVDEDNNLIKGEAPELPISDTFAYAIQKGGVITKKNGYLSVNIPAGLKGMEVEIEKVDDQLQDGDIKLGSWSEIAPNIYDYPLYEDGGKLVATPFGTEYVLERGSYPFAVIAQKPGVYNITIKGISDEVPVEYTINGVEVKEGKTKQEAYSMIGLEVGNRLKVEDKIVTLSDVSDMNDIKAVDLDGNTISVSAPFLLCNHKATETIHNIVFGDNAYFEGYVYENAKPLSLSMWDKKEWQKTILSTLTTYEGLLIALTSRVDLDYRYIIDTFESFIDTEIHKELSYVAMKKDNALAILNFPSIKTFKDCPYTSFTDEKNNFQMKYIAMGGNKKKVMNGYIPFSLPTEMNGASYCTFNTSLLFSDGTIKTVVPSAGLVSNKFMDKYTSRQPYYIVAGPNYSNLSYNELVGPDFNFSRSDLDILEPMGVNAIVYVPRLGIFINSNQTAKQNPVTALSKIHVRELVIYLQDEIEKLLQSYQWDFNTPSLRDKIKEKANYVCEQIKNNGGIYEYLNVCDESNNTDDVINNEMIVLSTSIEPGMGCGKMVQELTIYAKGGMSSLIIQ